MATYTLGWTQCTGTDPNTNTHPFSGRVVLTETVNTSDNTSTVQWSFQTAINNTAYQSGWTSSSGNYVTVSINGATVFGRADVGGVSYAGHYYNGTVGGANGPIVLASGTVTVPHNDDGTKILAVTAKFENSKSALYYMTSITVSGNVTLTPIARASAITSASNCNIGSSTSVKWTPATTTYGYKLTFSCGSWTATTAAIAPGSTSAYTYSYTIPAAVAEQIKTSTTGTVTVKLTTYSETACTNVLGTSTKTITVTVPNNSTYNPTASLSVTAVSGTAYGSYNLTGRTQFTTTCTVGAKYSATLSFTLVITDGESKTVYQTSGTATTTVTVGTFPTAGTYRWTLTVTDSRGRTASATTTKVITEYSLPTISASIVRGSGTTASSFVVDETSGTCARITYSIAYSAIGSNAVNVTISPPSGTAQTKTTATGTVYFGSSYQTSRTYTFTVTVYDSISTSSTTVTKKLVLEMAKFPIDFLEDASGMAINEIADESGYLKMGWGIKMQYEPINIYDASGNLRVVLDCDTGLQLLNANGVRLAGTVRNVGLTSGTDLNTITDIGMYNAGSNSLAAALVNCPTKKAFYLTVENIGNSANGWIRFQTIKDYDGEMYGRRAYKTADNLTFSAWKKAAPLDATTDASFGTSSKTVSSVAWDITSIGSKRICAASVTKTVNINYAWGNVYNGTNSASNANFPSITYPVTFAAEPKCLVTLSSVGDGGDAWVTTNCEYSPSGTEKLSKSPAYDLGRATAKSVTATLNYLVIGNV